MGNGLQGVGLVSKESGGVAYKVEKLIRPAIEELGLRLWDVRYEKEGPEWFLKVLIDRAEPEELMDTDTCELASRAIDPIIDEADPISQSYYLEVGSPGLGRKLTRPEHFVALVGQKIEAKLYKPNADGHKEVAGVLTGLQDDVVTLETPLGTQQIPLKEAGQFKLCDDEDLFG